MRLIRSYFLSRWIKNNRPDIKGMQSCTILQRTPIFQDMIIIFPSGGAQRSWFSVGEVKSPVRWGATGLHSTPPSVSTAGSCQCCTVHLLSFSTGAGYPSSSSSPLHPQPKNNVIAVPRSQEPVRCQNQSEPLSLTPL